MKLFAVEGNYQHLDGGAMFGNVPKELWKKWVPTDEKNRIKIACRSLLVQTDSGRNILFDVGIGAFFEPKLKERYGVFDKEHRLLENLAEMGISEADIDAVMLSHLHFDHAGGLLPPTVKPLAFFFPTQKSMSAKSIGKGRKIPISGKGHLLFPFCTNFCCNQAGSI